MNTQQAILATLEDSGAADMIELVGAIGHGAGMRVEGLPVALHGLIRQGLVGVACGVYFLTLAYQQKEG